MDESAIEAAGLTPLKPELARIDKIGNAADLQAEIARLQAYGVNAGFRFTAEQDRRKSTEVIAYAGQGGLGLPDRDYYLKDDDESKQIREKYLAHVQKMFALMGEDEKKAASDAKTVMDLETKLAEASMTRVERRDPEATYNRKTADDLAKLTPHFSWAAYFKAARHRARRRQRRAAQVLRGVRQAAGERAARRLEDVPALAPDQRRRPRSSPRPSSTRTSTSTEGR